MLPSPSISYVPCSAQGRCTHQDAIGCIETAWLDRSPPGPVHQQHQLFADLQAGAAPDPLHEALGPLRRAISRLGRNRSTAKSRWGSSCRNRSRVAPSGGCPAGSPGARTARLRRARHRSAPAAVGGCRGAPPPAAVESLQESIFPVVAVPLCGRRRDSSGSRTYRPPRVPELRGSRRSRVS